MEEETTKLVLHASPDWVHSMVKDENGNILKNVQGVSINITFGESSMSIAFVDLNTYKHPFASIDVPAKFTEGFEVHFELPTEFLKTTGAID